MLNQPKMQTQQAGAVLRAGSSFFARLGSIFLFHHFPSISYLLLFYSSTPQPNFF